MVVILKTYPIATYYLQSGDILIYIPDLNIVIQSQNDDFDEETGTFKFDLDVELDIDDMPEPSDVDQIDWRPDKALGVSGEEVVSVDYGRINFMFDEAYDESERSHKNEERSLIKEVYQEKPDNNTSAVTLEISTSLLALMENTDADLSSLLEEAIIKKIFYDS